MANKPLPPRPDALREVIGQTVADNPEIRAGLERLVKLLIKDAERTIRYGDERERAALFRSIVPGMLKSMQDTKDTGESEERAAFERVMEAVRRGRSAPTPPEEPGAA